MKLINEYRTGKIATRVYRHVSVRDADSAAELIARAAALEPFRARYIALWNPELSGDDGNSNRQLPADTTAGEIRQEMAGDCCTKLYLSGKYRRANAGIGIDLRSFDVSVTMSAALKEQAESLAALLDGLTV